MPVKAIAKKTVAQNGIGAFVLPCYKVVVQYCNFGGSSHGLRQLLSSGQFDKIAQTNNKIAFDIVKRSGHPKLRFQYNTGKSEDVSVANLSPPEIVKKFHQYSQAAGNDLFKWNHKVLSTNESVRGVWSPLHVAKKDRHRI